MLRLWSRSPGSPRCKSILLQPHLAQSPIARPAPSPPCIQFPRPGSVAPRTNPSSAVLPAGPACEVRLGLVLQSLPTAPECACRGSRHRRLPDVLSGAARRRDPLADSSWASSDRIVMLTTSPFAVEDYVDTCSALPFDRPRCGVSAGQGKNIQSTAISRLGRACPTGRAPASDLSMCRSPR